MNARLHHGLVLALAAMFLGGCLDLGKESPPVRYYLLSPLPGVAPADAVVLVEPVVLPPYLRRPQIVTRRQGNEIGRAEFDRWGEPLEESIRRVVGENLALLDVPGGEGGWRVRLEIVRFEGGPGGEVELQARWSVAAGEKSFRSASQASVREPVTAAGYDAMVAAMSRALASLSREIAARN